MLAETTIEEAMRRAIAVARRGPAGDPNPQVGCVLLGPDGRIVAEGWHRGVGTPHAETDALSQLPEPWRGHAGELTAVVTLEPCNHTGHTGPCARALIEAGIGSVVYAQSDPSELASGGADALRAAGVDVRSGVLAGEARTLLEPWLQGQRQNPGARLELPRITVKWAQTLDGRAAAADGSSRWITGPEARAHVHHERAAADAILVGTGTLLADDPSLTARRDDGTLLVPEGEQPIPIVLGRRRIPADARVRQHPALAARGLSTPIQLSGEDLARDIAALREHGIGSVFVEGGPTVASALIAAGLADEVLVYLAPALLGGPLTAIGDLGITGMSGIKPLSGVRIERLGNDLLVRGAIAAAAPRDLTVAGAAQEEEH